MKREIAFSCPPLTHFHLVTLLRIDVEFFPNHFASGYRYYSQSRGKLCSAILNGKVLL